MTVAAPTGKLERPPQPALTYGWAGLWLVLAGAYLFVYGWLPLEVQHADGTPYQRGEFLAFVALPEELAAQWFGSDGVVHLADRLPVLGTLLLWLLMATAVGWLLLLAVRAERFLTWLEQLVFAQAAGLNLLSTWVLVIGTAGQLHAAAVVIPGAIALALAALLLYKRLRMQFDQTTLSNDATSPSDAPSKTVPQRDYGAWFWGLLAILFAVVILLGSLTPPSEFDVREYHLQAPKEFFQQGRITFLPHNVYANMPLGAEMHALAAMLLTNDWQLGALVGKAMLGWFAILTAGGLYVAGCRLANAATGALAALVYLATPWIYFVSTTGLIEGASGCYLLFAWLAVWLWREQPRPAELAKTLPLLILAGYLSGSALACKYPNLVLVVLPLAVWVGWPNRQANMLLRAQWVSLFLLAAVAGGGMWWLKNGVLTGNPVYPLLADWLGGATRTAALNASWQAAHAPPNYALSDVFWRAWLFLIGSNWQGCLLVPLWLAGLIRWRTDATWKPRGLLPAFGIVASALAIWWLTTHRIERFWVPLLPLCALTAAVCVSELRAAVWVWLLRGVVVLGCTLSFLLDSTVAGAYQHHRWFASLQELWTDPQRLNRWHAALADLVPPDHQVLCIGEAEVFDLEPKLIYHTVFDPCIIDVLAHNRTPRQIWLALQDQRVSHLYVDWESIQRWRQPGNYGFCPLVTPELFQQWVKEGILYPPLPPPPGATAASGEVYPVRRQWSRGNR